MIEILVSLSTALIAAAASIIVVLLTSYKNRKLSYFQTYSAQKLNAYSSFWSAAVRYERTRAEEDELSLVTALHVVCLLAPLSVYEKALNSTGKLQSVAHLSGQDIQELMDLMRLDLDQCRRMKFPQNETVDANISLNNKE